MQPITACRNSVAECLSSLIVPPDRQAICQAPMVKVDLDRSEKLTVELQDGF